MVSLGYRCILIQPKTHNQIYPLSPGVTRERVLAELEFYGLQDFEGVPSNRSVETTLRIPGEGAKWQKEQERLGQKMVIEGFARLLVARAELVQDAHTVSFETDPLKISNVAFGASDGQILAYNYDYQEAIAELFAKYNTTATVSVEEVKGGKYKGVIKLEPAAPAAGA